MFSIERNIGMRIRCIFPRIALIAAIVGGGGCAAAASCCKPDDCAPAVYQSKRIAFIAGVDKYSGKTPFADRLADLTNAVNDATAVSKIFGEHSYQVRCLINPTLQQYSAELDRLKGHLQELQSLSSDKRSGNSVVVHFSGHGFRTDDADYIFFSGDHASKKAALDNALRISDVLNRLNEFTDVNIFFMFDSCRNFGKWTSVKPAVMPNWPAAGYRDPNAYVHRKADRHTLFYSTRAGSLAHDISSDVDGKDNGAFVQILKKYLKLVSLDLTSVYLMVGNDPSMTKIDQKPDYLPAMKADPPPHPWAAEDDECAVYERKIAEMSMSCVAKEGNRAACFGDTVCRPWVALLDNRTHSNGAACTRTTLASVFSEIASCPTPNVPVASLLPVVPAPDTAFALAPDLSRLRREALLASAPQRIQDKTIARNAVSRPASQPVGTMRDLIEQAAQIQQVALSANQTAPLEQVIPLRNKIFLTAREGTGLESFSDATSATLQPPRGTVELQMLPGKGGGTTGPLRPIAPVKVDCQTQYCNTDWVMMRVPTKKGVVDGWVAADQVTARPAAAIVDVEFVPDQYRPTRESLVKLQDLIATARESRNAVIKVTAVMEKADAARLLGNARATYVSNILSGRAMSADRVSIRLIETALFASYSPVTVELFRAPQVP